MNLQPFSLEDLSKRFTEADEFIFHRFEDGFFTYTVDTEPFAQSIVFYPTPFAALRQPMTITDILPLIDTSRHFGLKIHF